MNEQVNKVTIKANSDYTLPDSLNIPGYRFNCWRDASGTEITEISNINKDTIITADLTKVCNVTIDADGVLTNYTVDAGSTITEPEKISKFGYTFQGWVLDGSEELIDFETFIVNEDVTIKAFFTSGETIYSAVTDFQVNESTHY